MPTRKVGSTLQPLTVDITIPTDVDLSPSSIDSVKLRVCEAEPPYTPVGEYLITEGDPVGWSLSGTAPNQVMTLTWFEADPALTELEYLGEVHILANNGRTLVAPNDGYVHLRLQEVLQAPVES